MTDAGVLEHRLSRVLSVGGLVSTLLFAAGLAVLFAGRGALSEPLLHAGVLMLFATPFARVILMTVSYWRDRDWMFVAMTMTVLLVLIGGVIVAVR